MILRPFPFLLAGVLVLTGFSALAQDDPRPKPPAPPTPPESSPRPPDPDRPPAPPQGRGGPRDDRRDNRPEPRHDGDGRHSEDGARHEHERGPAAPSAPPVATPYLGVITLPPPPVLSAQLGLKEGFGLVVGDVLPDSPAAKSGLQKYDVLTKFNDQQLVDAGQFSTLVRGAGKDSDATVTILRQAKEQTVPVKVGERMAPPRLPFPNGMDFRGPMENRKGPGQDGMKRMQERAREFGEKMHQYQEQLKGWQKNPSAEMPQPPPPPAFDPENASLQISPADILVQAQPGGTRQIRLLQPNGAISYNTADAKMLMKDESGDIEVSSRDGKRVLLARDAKGETIFNGPIDTDEQRKALPEDIRKKIETIHVRAAAPASTEAPSSLPPRDDNVQ